MNSDFKDIAEFIQRGGHQKPPLFLSALTPISKSRRAEFQSLLIREKSLSPVPLRRSHAVVEPLPTIRDVLLLNLR